MKKIYIVLTHTGTILSRIIKTFTKDEFTHSSIALDVELKQMYSFGRLNPYNPFVGGFVHEYIDKGTFKRFYKTKAKVYALKVTDAQYEAMKNNIASVQDEKQNYSFNRLGLFAVGLHRKIRREHAFYCAEFVKYMLEKSGIEADLPELIKPEDFKGIKGLQEVYAGILRNYSSPVVSVADLIRENLFMLRKKEGVV